jgi:hypothetical protein
MNGEPNRGFWDRLVNPSTVIAATIGTLVGVVTIVAFFRGGDKTVVVRSGGGALSSPLAGQRIKNCIRRHHLRAPRVSVGGRNDGNVTFKRCDWPPLVQSSTDGYTEVWSHNHELPKPAAAPYNTVSTFRAPCDQLDVSFVQDHMEFRDFTSRRLERGRIYEVAGVPGQSVAIRVLDQVPPDVKIPLPTEGGNGFYVLYSGHFALFDAHCPIGAPPH